MNKSGLNALGAMRSWRWVLSPALLLFAIVMPLLTESWTLKQVVLMAGVELICACLLGALWLSGHLREVALRGLAWLVFLAYAAYLVDRVWFSSEPFQAWEPRSKASPRNALLGFLIIGLPCLWFAVLGRWTIHPGNPEQQQPTDGKSQRN